MHNFRIMTVAGVIYMLANSVCLAADTPNFSGHWILDVASSKLSFKPVSSQTLDIKQTGSTLEVVDATGGMKTKHSYTLDGVKRKVDVEGVVMVELSAKWQGSSIQMESDSGKMKTLETWQLQDGGNTIAIDRTNSGLVSRKDLLKYRKK